MQINFFQRSAFLVCSGVLLNASSAVCQKIEATSVTPAIKKAEIQELRSAARNAETGEYSISFVGDKNSKTTRIDTYVFGSDLALKSTSSQEIDGGTEKGDKKGDKPSFTDQVFMNNVIRVNLGGGIFKAKIQKGDIVKEYQEQTYFGNEYNLHVKSTDFYKLKFVSSAEKELRSNTADRKLQVHCYATDEPREKLSMGTHRPANIPALSLPDAILSYKGEEKQYSKASGDVVILGSPVLKARTRENPKTGMSSMYYFTIQRYSAETFDLVNEKDFELEYAHVVEYSTQLEDGSMLVLFRPSPKIPNVPKELVKSNLSEWILMKISMQGEVVEKFTFTSQANLWSSEKALTLDDGSILLYGPTKSKSGGSFDGFQIGRFVQGKALYAVNCSEKDLEANTVTPQSQKKGAADASLGKIEEFYVSEDGKSLTFVSANKTMPSLSVTQFSAENGKLIKTYNLAYENDDVAAGKELSHFYFSATNKNSANLFLFEIGDIDDGALFMYPRIGSINFDTKTMSEFIAPGEKSKTLKTDFYLNRNLPFLAYENGGKKEFVFIGSDKSYKSIWLSRVTAE